MLTLSLRDPHVLGTVGVSVLCIGGVAAWLAFRRRPSAEEIERERRAELVRTGRIIDGTILDISEFETVPDSEPRDIRFILYKYEIGGVEYECSQDVSALRDYVRAEDLHLSFPCSVRYDVHHPENSIIVAENWSGLRATAHSLPPQRTTQPRQPRTSAPAAH